MYGVVSSNVYAVGYENGILYVRFRNGSMYEYFDVPDYIFHGMLAADSKGKYLHVMIKDKYRYQRVA